MFDKYFNDLNESEKKFIGDRKAAIELGQQKQSDAEYAIDCYNKKIKLRQRIN